MTHGSASQDKSLNFVFVCITLNFIGEKNERKACSFRLDVTLVQSTTQSVEFPQCVDSAIYDEKYNNVQTYEQNNPNK